MRFGRNVTSSWARIATQAAIAIVMTPVLLHGLGKAQYGIWALALSLVVYLELFDFGLGTATVKYVAESEALGDREQTTRIVATSFWTLAVPGLGALALSCVIAAAFPVLFDVPESTERAAQLLMLLVGVDLAFSIPSDTFGATLLALQRFDIVNVTLIAVAVGQAIAWAIVIALGGGLVALGLVTVVISLAGQLSRYLIVRSLLPGVTPSPRRFERKRVRPLATLSGWYALAETSTLAIARLDVVVVALVLGLPEAAVYAVAQKLAFLVDQVIRPMMRMFFPHSSVLSARRERGALGETLLVGTRVATAIAGPLTLTLAIFAEPTLRAWVGAGFAEGALVVVFLCAAAAVVALTGTASLVLQGAGFARRPGLLSAGEAILNLSLSVVLGLELGIKGVALATLIGAVVFQVGLLLPYACRTFDIPLARFAWMVLRAHVPALALALLVGWVGVRSGIDGTFDLGVAATATVAAYVAVLAATGLDRGERRLAFALLRSRTARQATHSA
jgi:O-antigen/teichoic acid export membrane protein